jgi:hypothetical protein
LTRVSITLHEKSLSKKMDCRVKPGNDDDVDGWVKPGHDEKLAHIAAPQAVNPCKNP